MADDTPDSPAPDQPADSPDTGAEVDYKAEAEKWQALARKHEDRAKANSNAAKELEQVRRQSMTDVERAAAEAEARGRSAALTDFGKRLARSEFTTAAAKRNPGFNTGDALDYLDFTRFVGEDGEPDLKAIGAAVERLVPVGDAPPSFDGGVRTSAPIGSDMNSLLRRATGRS